MNRDKWFDKPQDGDPTPESALIPFHYDTKKSRWTSNLCRDWLELRYQYDDLVRPTHTVTDEATYEDNLRAHLKVLYPSTSEIIKQTGVVGETFDDYIINVVYDRYALKGRAYTILFFIGSPPQALSQYHSSENFVGAVYTFSTPVETRDGSTACSNCAKQRSDKVLSKAQISLTLPLHAKARQARDGGPPQAGIPALPPGALDRHSVERFLSHDQEGLRWEFVEIGGARREHADFPDTEVAVLQGTGSHPRGREHLPRYEGYSKLTKATENQYLGFGHPRTRSRLIRDDH